MRALSALVLLASLSLACNKDKPAEADKESSAKKEDKSEKKSSDKKKGDKTDEKSGDGTDEKTDEKKSDKKADAKGDKKKPAAPSKEKQKVEKDKLSEYWAAMTAGRKATLAKKYDDAYAAFDKALKALPDDARAISERGYAKLLAKDYKGAVADLDTAVVRTSDKKLLGQIYYNYGLAAEGQGDAEAARAAFARSDTYNPTPAAKKKLAGKSACTAIIESDKPGLKPKMFDSWKAAYDDLASGNEELEKWKSEEGTLAGGFCTNKWKKGDACVAVVHGFMQQQLFVLTPTTEGKIASFELDYAGGICGGEITPKLVLDEGDVTHVHWKTMQGIRIYVTEKNGEIVDCGEGDECMGACGSESDTYSDFFIEKAKGESMLYVGRTEDAGKDPLTIKVEMPTVTIKGKGCDAERPLAK